MAKYRIYHWVARLSGFLGLVFFIAFLLGRGLEILKTSNSNFDLLFILTLFSFALVSNIIGWFIEVVGGFLLLLCGLAILTIVALSDVFGTFYYTIAFSLPFLIPGIFYIISWKIKYSLKPNMTNNSQIIRG